MIALSVEGHKPPHVGTTFKPEHVLAVGGLRRPVPLSENPLTAKPPQLLRLVHRRIAKLIGQHDQTVLAPMIGNTSRPSRSCPRIDDALSARTLIDVASPPTNIGRDRYPVYLDTVDWGANLGQLR